MVKSTAYGAWTLIAILAGFPSASRAANDAGHSHDGLPHLDLEMTGREYESLIREHVQVKANDPLQAILAAGRRNLEWLDAINGARSPERKLELSTAETQVGIPIEQPGTSNRDIVQIQWSEVVSNLPAAMKAVIVDGGAVTPEVPVPDTEFLKHARLVDRGYQRASRWLLQEPSLFAYAARAYMDVRGYYYLSKEENLDQKLVQWGNVPDADKQRLSGYLVGLCRNSRVTLQQCQSRLATAVERSGNPKAFYDQYIVAGRNLWDGMFKIGATRRDVTWTRERPNEFRIPFLNPGRADVTDWLRDNIQDEWRWNGWQLFLDFVDRELTPSTTRVVFEAGATPHVNGLGGNEITMDANRALNEYSSRWTIRHEYGHVLGFPDCYVEFYDDVARVMVNYQLDITNLMCSRRGKLQEKHVEELRRIYWRG